MSISVLVQTKGIYLLSL